MNAAEHRAEAERLLELAEEYLSESHPAGEHKADILAAAQVHATLATIPDVPASPYSRTVAL